MYGHSPHGPPQHVLPGRYPPGYGVGPAPPPGAYGWGVPQGYPMYMPPRMVERKDPGLAVALELIGGLCFGTFGVGHIYAGNVGTGIAWMVGYWVMTFVNIILFMLLIGIITWPICVILACILAPMSASNSAKRANALAGYHY